MKRYLQSAAAVLLAAVVWTEQWYDFSMLPFSQITLLTLHISWLLRASNIPIYWNW